MEVRVMRRVIVLFGGQGKVVSIRTSESGTTEDTRRSNWSLKRDNKTNLDLEYPILQAETAVQYVPSFCERVSNFRGVVGMIRSFRRFVVVF